MPVRLGLICGYRPEGFRHCNSKCAQKRPLPEHRHARILTWRRPMTNKMFTRSQRRHREYHWHFNFSPFARPQAPSPHCVKGNIIKLRKSARLDHANICRHAGFQINLQSEHCYAFVVEMSFAERIIWLWPKDCIRQPWHRSSGVLSDIADTSYIYRATKLIVGLC